MVKSLKFLVAPKTIGTYLTKKKKIKHEEEKVNKVL